MVEVYMDEVYDLLEPRKKERQKLNVFNNKGEAGWLGVAPHLSDCKVIFMIFPIPIFVSHLFPIYIYKYIILYDKYFVPLF